MTFDDSEHYNISSFDAWLDWESLTSFPNGSAYVQLEPNGREFGLSMFRQLRCLNILRVALIDGPGDESKRCLNLLRQAILCASDITLDALNIEIDGQLKATDGAGMTHSAAGVTGLTFVVYGDPKNTSIPSTPEEVKSAPHRRTYHAPLGWASVKSDSCVFVPRMDAEADQHIALSLRPTGFTGYIEDRSAYQ
ncbi:hypothetical protein POSPLADRAFT_1065664 [Postia placenta MAD-698-R-SB12]|uniref:Uncharacterized protein n=1 Tax=Postia placenta MAD-698-R-SB12 TaxID=670580 RepID=A0A1X6N3W7_9APHY|nr:hypothetical protein POSPLADRAFT_1065664 [Postia placenta MAD-698-R-SB12]OSX63304.1 hypothetical protein POSPLADRAFT_1065664 [Postia placenta MAD-698-R-SB12]